MARAGESDTYQGYAQRAGQRNVEEQRAAARNMKGYA